MLTILNKKYGTKGEKIGEGKYGNVYRFHRNNEMVAVKKSTKPYTEGYYYLREAVYQKSINHPSIAKLLDIYLDCSKDKIIFVFELAYISLSSFLENSNIQKDDQQYQNQLKSIVYDLTLALACLRNNNILHRDLSPCNVLLFKKGENHSLKYSAKLGDFGVARKYLETSSEETTMSSNTYSLACRPIEIILRREYRLENEIYLSCLYGFPAEIWAFACLIYSVFYQEILFKGYTSSEMIIKITEIRGLIDSSIHSDLYKQGLIPFPKPSNIIGWESFVTSKSMDSQLAELLDRMLDYNPSKRIDIFGVIDHPFFNEMRKQNLNNRDDFSQQDLNTNMRMSLHEILDSNDHYPKIYFENKSLSDLKLRKENLTIIVAQKIFNNYETTLLAIYLYDKYYSVKGSNINNFKSKEIFLKLLVDISARLLSSDIYGLIDSKITLPIEADILETIEFNLNPSLITDYLQIYLNDYDFDIRQIVKLKMIDLYLTELPFLYKAQELSLALIKIVCKDEDKEFKSSQYVKNSENFDLLVETLLNLNLIYR